nr:Ty3/gypsy retrotransposon protein [Tanacetum cinerariifolium]
MPLGLSNAPSTFQSAMNDIFLDVFRRFVLVFFDDILIYSPTHEQHYDYLRHVFSILTKHMYYAKLSKCIFLVHKVQYLGHVISSNDVATDPEKIKTIQEWPKPTSITGLRGFLGAGYYKRFVQGYAHIAAPLTDLLQHKQIQWNDGAEEAFQSLKTAMTTLPVLALLDFTLIFDVTTDASEAVKKWRQYLLGSKFHVFTDQSSLKYLLTQVMQTPEQHKWAAKLLRYDFEDMTSKFDKLAKFEGQDVRRWQKKMHFLLTTLKVVYVLSTPSFVWSGNETLETNRKRMKWENDDYICRGHILNEEDQEGNDSSEIETLTYHVQATYGLFLSSFATFDMSNNLATYG